MADKPINTLPVKTAPAAGDKMLMIGAAEEYQIDYDKLASAILDKLATKQYSELDTTAKTVLGALDELNGNMSNPENITVTDGEYGHIVGSFKLFGRFLIFSFNITLTKDYVATSEGETILWFNGITPSYRYDFPVFMRYGYDNDVADFYVPLKSTRCYLNIGNGQIIKQGEVLFCSGIMIVD